MSIRACVWNVLPMQRESKVLSVDGWLGVVVVVVWRQRYCHRPCRAASLACMTRCRQRRRMQWAAQGQAQSQPPWQQCFAALQAHRGRRLAAGQVQGHPLPRSWRTGAESGSRWLPPGAQGSGSAACAVCPERSSLAVRSSASSPQSPPAS